MGGRKKLLIANDTLAGDTSFASSFAHALSRWGVELTMAATAQEALEQIRKTRFDLLVTDVSLEEERSGIDLIRSIRKFDKEIKIVVSTGGGRTYEAESLEAGANWYFEKPYNLPEHFLKPLGIRRKGEFERRQKVAPPKDQMTLSKAIHEIENMNNLAIMASSILNEVTDKFLKAEELSGKTKEIIEQARHDSAEIESACQRADNLLKWTRRSIYPLINADHVMIDCSVSLEDDSDEQEDFDS